MSLLSCGVTVVKPVRKEKKQKTGNESVRHNPILGASSTISINFAEDKKGTRESIYQEVAVNHTRSRMKGLLRKRSPSGHRNNSPDPYPACARVGIKLTRS